MTLSKSDIDALNRSLYYLHVKELKEICEKLKLPAIGNKVALIKMISFYSENGKIRNISKIPTISKATKSSNRMLEPTSKILQGSFKNDLATRKFMKKMVGNHFHYTAFGIDWINQRWMDGSPPTYEEFAKFWQNEQEKRKKEKVPPKKEWAYINFVQQHKKKYPNAKRDVIMLAWKKARKEHLFQVNQLLQNCGSS